MWGCEKCGEQFCNDCKPINGERHEKILCDCCRDNTDTHEAGQCPSCGGSELEYDGGEVDGGAYIYKWECADCHTTGREVYNMTFVEHMNLQR